MKKCKFCMTEIDDKAKICPNCKKDLRDFAGRHPIITVILFLFILGSVMSWLSELTNTTNQGSNITNNNYSSGLSNFPSNGIWDIGYYTDDFGDRTNESVITNKEYIKGTFSNTATENSSLNVKFLIDNADNISIKLFEYSGNNPVKSASHDSYTLNIKDKDGNKYKFRATNDTDRLTIKKLTSTDLGPKDLYDILLKGGEIKFAISDNNFPSQYYFTINADGFNNIVKQK